MLLTLVRYAAYALFYLVGLAVFVLGLGEGLTDDPFIGSVMWIAALAIVLLNTLWIAAGESRRQ